MKNKKIAALFVSGMMMAAALAGCAGSSASSTSSTAAPAGSAPASTSAPSEQPAPQDKPIKIGVAMASVQSTAFQAMADALEAKATELGAEAVVLSAEHSLERQIDQVQDMITQKCDAIIINSVDAEGIVPVVEEANRQGIKILAIDRKIAGGTVDYAIETDNLEAGRSAAKFFGEQANGEQLEVLLLISDPTATALRERQDGFKQGLQDYPNLKLVAEPSIGTSTEKAYNATIDAFKANPNIKVIFTSGDIWVAPIQSALKELGKLAGPEDAAHVMIGSVDGEKACLDAIREGTQDVVIAQLFTDIANKCMETAVGFANGEMPQTTQELYPVIVVSRENIDTLGPDKLWGLAG